MCTVSIIPITSGRRGIRLACNRDESRLRPPAAPPQILRLGLRRAVMPIDPVSQGTWISANDSGLVMTLLNTYAVPFDRERFLASTGWYRSRGALIPSLLAFETLDQAFERGARLDASAYPDFRLLMLDLHRVAEISAAAGRLAVSEPGRIEAPVMYTSSGLGDALVFEPRQTLFDEMLATGDPISAQDAFHRHQWPDRPHVSVCMSRPEARTVSLTVVELRPDAVRMIYHPESPDRAPEPVTVDLPIVSPVSCEPCS